MFSLIYAIVICRFIDTARSISCDFIYNDYRNYYSSFPARESYQTDLFCREVSTFFF